MRWTHVVLFAFILGQFLDGLLTYIGLSIGMHEGNPLMVSLMNMIGVIPTLLAAKGFCILSGIAVYACGYHRGLIIGNIVVWVIAVIPWVITLIVLGPQP